MNEYLDQYEQHLMESLLKTCIGLGVLDHGRLPVSTDITDRWEQLAPSYMVDAVREIAQYPSVALGWAMYLGMAVARYWDDDWATYAPHPNLYEHLRDKRGFDCMDEAIREEVLGFARDTAEYTRCEDLVRSCAEQALSQIRHEQIEPASPTAFHVFARSTRVLYILGAAVTMRRLGYKMEAISPAAGQ